jgi:hypothetical protein
MTISRWKSGVYLILNDNYYQMPLHHNAFMTLINQYFLYQKILCFDYFLTGTVKILDKKQ